MGNSISDHTAEDQINDTGNPHKYGLKSDPNSISDNEERSVNDGKEIWNKLVKLHSNFMFVFSGHHMGGESFIIDEGENGNSVYQLLSDFQDHENGGNGYIL